MYDSVGMFLGRENCRGAHLLKHPSQFLSRVTQGTNDRNESFAWGHLENLKVEVKEDSVRISQGSLSKYFLSDSFRALTIKETKEAIEKISDTLHLPFRLASVRRIDLAQNLKMNYSESIYYHYLGQSKHYERLEQKNGLYYNTQKRQLVFYGKIHEQKKNRQIIPEQFESENLLRFELRFKNRLLQQFNLHCISAEFLYDKDFFHSLISRWEEEYFAIKKLKPKSINMKPTGSRKKLIENLAFLSISEIGQPTVLRQVREWQAKKLITRKQAFHLRATIKGISQIKMNEGENDLINELDSKVKAAANEARYLC